MRTEFDLASDIIMNATHGLERLELHDNKEVQLILIDINLRLIPELKRKWVEQLERSSE